MSRGQVWCAVVIVALLTPMAHAQPAAGPASAVTPTWRLSATNLTRAETWRFFEPFPGGGDPDYTFLGDRLRVDLRGHWPRVDLTLSAQYGGVVGLPNRASGPGALGTGALYFDQGGRESASSRLYLRFANLRFPNLGRGLDLQIGRMGYTSGAEMPSGVPKIETVKRQRLDARLVGEFEWSLYQRAFDGVRLDVTRPRWRTTAVAFLPTQGGFARNGGSTITDLLVAGATLSSRPPQGAGRRFQVQGFGWHYRDRRAVTARPDNSGRPASRVAIDVASAGAVLLGAIPAGRGEADVLAWVAGQAGRWYGDPHRAVATVFEGGYQWTAMAWRPWVRAGWFHASGDDDPVDSRHGTFFPMLPTVRRFAQTTAYGTMNLRDVFVQVQARPRTSLALRADVRRLDLASAADLWYAGSGATLTRGTVFGYTGRRGNGSRRLGTAIEGSADYAVTPRVSVNGFAGYLVGGPVVTASFRNRSLWFLYLETAFTMGAR